MIGILNLYKHIHVGLLQNLIAMYFQTDRQVVSRTNANAKCLFLFYPIIYPWQNDYNDPVIVMMSLWKTVGFSMGFHPFAIGFMSVPSFFTGFSPTHGGHRGDPAGTQLAFVLHHRGGFQLGLEESLLSHGGAPRLVIAGKNGWLPSGDVKIAIENGHRNSGFTH